MNRIDVQLDENLGRRVRKSAQSQGVSQAEFSRRALSQFTASDRCPYSFSGSGEHSFLADYHKARSEPSSEKGQEAERRMKAFQRWQREAEETFAANTSTHGEVVPPGYESSPFVGVINADRPFFQAASLVQISSPTPFQIPTTVETTGLVSDHTEGTNPTAGSATVDAEAITPRLKSGTFELTRELLDASNPAMDAVAISAMREKYAQQVEQSIYEACNSAQSGTITAGRSPAGAQVSTAASGTLPAELKSAIGRYPFARQRRARTALASAEAVEALSGALDESTGDRDSLWTTQGVDVVPAPTITGNASGDADVFILSAGDLWVWESPILMMRFEERQGPHMVELALYGYHATRMLRPVGLSAIRYTA